MNAYELESQERKLVMWYKVKEKMGLGQTARELGIDVKTVRGEIENPSWGCSMGSVRISFICTKIGILWKLLGFEVEHAQSLASELVKSINYAKSANPQSENIWQLVGLVLFAG